MTATLEEPITTAAATITLEKLARKVRRLERQVKKLREYKRVVQSQSNIPVRLDVFTPEQEAEIDQMLDAYEKNPERGTPVEVVMARLQAKYGPES